ncbi:MAG: efflux RND transporter periplasmic adaptor subunit [Lysobacteraceae bacterium]
MKQVLRYAAVAAVVLFIGIVIGRYSGSAVPAGGGEGGAAKATEQAFLTVSVIAAQDRTVADPISVTGTMIPRENVLVIPQLSERKILSVHADVGDHVRRGQLLATIDGQDLQIDLKSLQSEYERAQGEYARARTLASSQLVSREFLKQKQAASDHAHAQLQDASLSAQRTRILAPADGLIYQRTATIGGQTQSQGSLFSIVQNGRIEMQAEVPEALAYRLKPGMQAAIHVAGQNQPLEGRIRLIAPQVDGQSRTTIVRIELPAADMAFAVGTFCEAKIVADSVDGWVVPSSSLQQDTQGAYVWQVDAKNRVRRMPVTVVMQTADHVVVRESLRGLRIVSKAGALLQDDDTVAVAKGEAT